ncbi:glycosyltransferase family 4 protein [Demequina sp. NBRC 110054]|uniref:glycosyltransferase family 4 protein n=1 Tax=Demequina sp. NBRC 110054 TaxID=1570343 RepID=UPI0009FFD01A
MPTHDDAEPQFVVFNPGTHPAPKWVAAEFARRGELAAYFTGFGLSRDEFERVSRLPIGRALRAALRARTLPPGIEAHQVKRGLVVLDLCAVATLRLGNGALTRRLLDARNRFLARRLVTWLRRRQVAGVLYPTGTRSGLHSSLNGVKTVLYTPLPRARFVRELLREEAQTNPRWAQFLETTPDSAVNAEDEEVSSASIILANSSFTARSFSELKPPPRTVVVPLSSDAEAVRHGARTAGGNGPRDGDSPTGFRRLCYVGQISQRKGLSYLFDALAGQDDVELTLIGADPLGMARELRMQYPSVRATFAGPLPQPRVWAVLATSDALVFPSLVEGFGNVINESIALGVPVLTTERTGAPDIPDFPHRGLVLRAGDVEALRHAIAGVERRDRRGPASENDECASESNGGWTRYAGEAVDLIVDAM